MDQIVFSTKGEMKYDVTIGIPVYNMDTYISKSLDSALSQSYPSIEFLIVDDSCCDQSIAIVRNYQKNHSRGADIRVLSNPSNLGVSTSRNRIIDEAQGEYLYFMDADDTIAENTITLLMQHIRQYDADIVFGSYEKTEVSGKKTVYQYPDIQLLEEDLLASFAYRKFGGIQASVCNYLVKLSVLRSNHLRFINVNYWEDLVFTFEMVTYIHRAVLLSQITYYYLCHENSLSHYQTRFEVSKDEILSNVRAIDYLKSNTSRFSMKTYYSERCYCVMMFYFYIICNILKRGGSIKPPFSNDEICAFMSYPATFLEIITFRHIRFKNLLLYFIGKLPPFLCVATIRCIAKMKKIG